MNPGRLAVPAVAMCALALVSTRAASDETALHEASHPFDEEPNQQYDIEGIEEGLYLEAFRSGSVLSLLPRTYYFNRIREASPDSQAWTLGGAIEYRSGWWRERIGIGATLFGSLRLYGPEDKDGTLLLKPGQESFGVLGEAFVTARLGEDAQLRVGRQDFTLPYVGRHDVRMAPNTFEAVQLSHDVGHGLSYVLGYVDSIKRINDDRFIDISQALGAAGSSEGLGVAAVDYRFDNGATVGAMWQRAFEVSDTWYFNAQQTFPLSEDVRLRASAQYTSQGSTGDALLGDFSTHMGAVMGEVLWGHAAFRLAASSTGSGRGIQSTLGSSPNFIAIIVNTFDRAGEDAWMVGASYDFAAQGLPELSLFANAAFGDTPDTGPRASPDATEYNLTIDYRFGEDSTLSGLWIRARAAKVERDWAVADGQDYYDYRIIVNYSFDVR